MNPFLLTVIIVVAILIILLTISYLFFLFACRRHKKQDGDPASSGIWTPHSEVFKQEREWVKANMGPSITITGFGNLKLVGIFIPAENARGTIVAFHGYRSNAWVDFIPEARYLHELGYNLILPHQRSHSESEGKYITYGALEREDCKLWLEYTEKRFGSDKNIFLAGISMGCATALMSLELSLPRNIRGVIADCGFTSPWNIMKHVTKKSFHLGAFPFLYLANLISIFVTKVNFKKINTLNILKQNKLPILFIHGADDDFVPTQMTLDNYHACASPKELLLVKGAGHATSFLTDPIACKDKISAFIHRFEL